MKNKKGFSLLELLVVMVIILILMAMIVMMVRKGDVRAKNARCIGNLKSLYQAVLIYSQETWPVNRTKSYPPSLNSSFIKSYMGVKESQIICPMLDSSSTFIGYAINDNLISSGAYKSSFEMLKTNNVFVFESVTSGGSSVKKRHEGRAYGMTIQGTLIDDLENSDLSYKS